MTVEEILIDNGYEGIMTFAGPDYEDALIGVSDDNRAIYDFDLMVESLVDHDDMTYEEAVEWIEYNTIRSLPYAGSSAPIIMYRLER